MNYGYYAAARYFTGMKLFRCLLAVLGLLLAGPARAAADPAGGWLPEAALSNLRLRTLVPTPDGLLWLGTDDGVYRYDGTRLVPLNALRRGGPALPPLPCDALLALPDGQLWLGTEVGLYRFCADGRLERLPLPAPASNNRRIDALALAADGRSVWVSQSQNGVRAYTFAGRAAGPLLRVGPGLLDVWPAPDGTLWLTSENGARQLNPGGQVLGTWLVPNRGLHAVYDPTGRPWLLSNGAACRLGPGGQLSEKLRWPPAAGTDLLRQPEGPVLLTQGQVRQLSWTPGNTPRPQLHLIASLPPWPTASWRGHLRADRAGRWWLFDTGSLGCWNRAVTPAFIRALPGPGGRAYSVRAAVRLPDRRLLVSSYGGLLTQAPDSPLAPLQHWRAAVLPTGNAPVLQGIVPRRLGPGGDWLAAGGYTFLRFDPRTGRLRKLLAAGQTQADISITSLALDSTTNRVWAGTQLGLYQYDATRQTFRPFVPPHPPAAAPPPAGRIIEDVCPDGRGHLWLATTEGVERLTLATGARVVYGPAAPAPHRVAADGARCLYLAPNGQLWVGTRTHGLAVIEPGGRAHSVLTMGQGLPSASVVTITPDPDGYLWLGTYQGLVRYQPATGRLGVFTTAHGLSADECNARAAYVDPADGSLLIGGVAGLHRIWPNKLPAPNLARPRLLLTSLTALSTSAAASRPHYLLAADALPTLHLAPDAPLIDLHLALTNTLDPGRARYAYRVRGLLADQWLGLGTTPQLRLQDLPPGQYTVEIRGETSQGVPAANVLRLPLTVRAVWWNRPLTWALGAAAAVLAVYLWQRNRLHQLRRETELRARLAADLHDEVGGLLTRVTMQAELLRELQADPPARLTALVDDSRAAASTVRDIIWSVDTAADTLAALVDRIRDHLDATARATGRHLLLDESGLPTVLNQPLPPAVRQHVYLIFREAITNALKYAQPGSSITVRLRYPAPLELLVTSEGEAPATSRAGQGLRNMRRRAELLRAGLHAGPAPGGWQVKLTVP